MVLKGQYLSPTPALFTSMTFNLNKTHYARVQSVIPVFEMTTIQLQVAEFNNIWQGILINDDVLKAPLWHININGIH